MRAVVTGVAGFVGSTLAERLRGAGHRVVGVDCFTPYYDPERKRANLAGLAGDPGFELVDADLRHDPLRPLLDGADAVFHLAAQPGVRRSWAEGFDLCQAHNVLGTQRLLEAARDVATPRVVFASSSSVYGAAAAATATEDDLPRPHSPYGVTKLAAEHLCSLYAANWGLPTVSLRYFTVYGPRQRPDMAMHRLVRAALEGAPFPLYGDGSQARSFTFVEDVVAATVAAAVADVAPGTVVNVAGGRSTTLAELIGVVEETTGRPVPLDRRPAAPGDVPRTGAAVDRAWALLGWHPTTDLGTGVAAQVAWQASLPVLAPT